VSANRIEHGMRAQLVELERIGAVELSFGALQ